MRSLLCTHKQYSQPHTHAQYAHNTHALIILTFSNTLTQTYIYISPFNDTNVEAAPLVAAEDLAGMLTHWKGECVTYVRERETQREGESWFSLV